MNKSSLLLVDDDRRVLESMADWLRGQGYDLDTAARYTDALEPSAASRTTWCSPTCGLAMATASTCSSNAAATGRACR